MDSVNVGLNEGWFPADGPSVTACGGGHGLQSGSANIGLIDYCVITLGILGYVASWRAVSKSSIDQNLLAAWMMVSSGAFGHGCVSCTSALHRLVTRPVGSARSPSIEGVWWVMTAMWFEPDRIRNSIAGKSGFTSEVGVGAADFASMPLLRASQSRH